MENREKILAPIFAVIIAMFIASLTVLFIGKDPWLCFSALWEGAAGNWENLINTLIKTTPLLLTGTAVAVAFTGGLFNIGGEGQLYIGGIAAAYTGTLFPGLSPFIYIPFILICSVMAGASWAMIAGWLKSKRGVHEVISTILLNYIAIYLADFLVNGPLKSEAYGIRTKNIAQSAELGVIWKLPVAQLTWDFPIALLGCVLIYIFFKYSIQGYLIRVYGANPLAAEYGGIRRERQILFIMGLSGACAGLAGGLIILGQQHTFYAQFSPGYGFDGIAVALLASNHPLGIIPGALFFGALRSADRWMQLEAGVPKEIVYIIQGIVILFIGVNKLPKFKSNLIRKLALINSELKS